MSAANAMTAPGFLDKERIIAPAGYTRWLVPPCALAIHLCIGMAYGFSVFWLPLSKAIGITKSVACPADANIFYYLTTTSCDWKVPMLQTWMFGLFFVFLGTASALWGGWLERVGPRKAGMAAALCWCGGLVISAIGVSQHQLWLIWLGRGSSAGRPRHGLHHPSLHAHQVVPGPARHGDRHGHHGLRRRGDDRRAAGSEAHDAFRDTDLGRRDRDLSGARGRLLRVHDGRSARLPSAPLRKPAGWDPSTARKPLRLPTKCTNVAWRTPQFWLVWLVLMLNVSAGIGIISMASPRCRKCLLDA
jgi:hypothetical protein